MRPSRVQRDQQIADLVPFGVVHSGGRLVEQQQLGLARERARDLDMALAAVGQILRVCAGELGHADSLERALGGGASGPLSARARVTTSQLESAPRWTARVAAPIITFASTVIDSSSRTVWNVRAIPTALAR